MVLDQGHFAPPGDIQQWLQIFLIFTTGEQRPEMLLNSPHNKELCSAKCLECWIEILNFQVIPYIQLNSEVERRWIEGS